MSILKNEDHKQIVELLKNPHMSMTKIAKQFDVSISLISKINDGVRPIPEVYAGPFPIRATGDRKKLIADYFENCRDVKATMEHFGISEIVLGNALRYFGWGKLIRGPWIKK